jgi:hypothetical protein
MLAAVGLLMYRMKNLSVKNVNTGRARASLLYSSKFNEFADGVIMKNIFMAFLFFAPGFSFGDCPTLEGAYSCETFADATNAENSEDKLVVKYDKLSIKEFERDGIKVYRVTSTSQIYGPGRGSGGGWILEMTNEKKEYGKTSFALISSSCDESKVVYTNDYYSEENKPDGKQTVTLGKFEDALTLHVMDSKYKQPVHFLLCKKQR